MADDAKTFFALLNGIARHDYYNEVAITDEFLRTELYPNMTVEDFTLYVSKIRGIIKSIVSVNMELNQLEAFLTSQIQKKDRGITADQARVLTKFWNNHRTRIHDSLVSNSTWGNVLKSFSWRIDVKSQTKSQEHINEPSAILQLQLSKSGKDGQDTENIQFEMNDSQVSCLLQSLSQIEEQIDKHTTVQQ